MEWLHLLTAIGCIRLFYVVCGRGGIDKERSLCTQGFALYRSYILYTFKRGTGDRLPNGVTNIAAIPVLA